MSDFETTFLDQDADSMDPASTDPGYGRMSGLSVASLVCSLILCCPFTTIVGFFLGIGALFQTRGGRRRGRGMGIAGIVLGALFTIGWVVLISVFLPTIQMVTKGPEAVMDAGYAKDNAVVKQYFAPSKLPSDEEIDRFFTEAKSRYGNFESATMEENSNPPQSKIAGELQIPYQFKFEKATLIGLVALEYETIYTGSGSMIGMTSIIIEDSEKGDLVLFGTEKASAVLEAETVQGREKGAKVLDEIQEDDQPKSSPESSEQAQP